MPSRRPCFVGTLGATSTSDAARSAATSSRVRGPASTTRSCSPAAAMACSRAGRSGPSPTRRRVTSTPSAASSLQASTRCPWPLTSCSVPTHSRRSGASVGPAAVQMRGEQRRVDAGPDHVDAVGEALAALGEDEPAVVLGDGGDERGLGHLLREHRAVDVQVRAVRGEAERDAGQPVDDEPGQRRVAGEVAVDVLHAVGLHLPGGVRGAREERECPGEELRAAPGAPQRRGERRQVAARVALQPVDLAGGDRDRHERRVVRRGGQRGRLWVHDLLALGLQRVHVDLDPAARDGQHLGQHERLAELGKARGDVGDALGGPGAGRVGRSLHGARGGGGGERHPRAQHGQRPRAAADVDAPQAQPRRRGAVVRPDLGREGHGRARLGHDALGLGRHAATGVGEGRCAGARVLLQVGHRAGDLVVQALGREPVQQRVAARVGGQRDALGGQLAQGGPAEHRGAVAAVAEVGHEPVDERHRVVVAQRLDVLAQAPVGGDALLVAGQRQRADRRVEHPRRRGAQRPEQAVPPEAPLRVREGGRHEQRDGHAVALQDRPGQVAEVAVGIVEGHVHGAGGRGAPLNACGQQLAERHGTARRGQPAHLAVELGRRAAHDPGRRRLRVADPVVGQDREGPVISAHDRPCA